MTWPTTQIATTNLDAGSDQPKLARADLLDTVNAVNAMIAYGDPKTMAVIKPEAPIYPGGYTEGTVTEIYDPSLMISLSANRFTLSAGTYLVEFYGTWYFNNTYHDYFPLWNYTTDLIALNGTSSNGGLLVLGSSSSIGFKYNSSIGHQISTDAAVKITKLA